MASFERTQREKSSDHEQLAHAHRVGGKEGAPQALTGSPLSLKVPPGLKRIRLLLVQHSQLYNDFTFATFPSASPSLSHPFFRTGESCSPSLDLLRSGLAVGHRTIFVIPVVAHCTRAMRQAQKRFNQMSRGRAHGSGLAARSLLRPPVPRSGLQHLVTCCSSPPPALCRPISPATISPSDHHHPLTNSISASLFRPPLTDGRHWFTQARPASGWEI